MLAEEKVRWDRSDDYVHASGWIPAGYMLGMKRTTR